MPERIFMNYEQLPKDPVMLLSFVNTQLRDFYSSPAELCHAFGIKEQELTDKLLSIDYTYDQTQNQFV